MRKLFVLIASGIVLLVLVKAAGFREVGDVWKSIRPEGVLLSVACYYASIGLRVLAWKRLLGSDDPGADRLAPPLALGIVLGHVTPAKSGEPVTAVLVARSIGIPLARALSILTAERGLQFVVLLATFLPAAAATAGRVLELQGAVRAAAILLGALVLGTLAAGPILRRLVPVAKRVPKIGNAVATYLTTLAEILSDHRRVVPLLALATGFWLLQYVSLAAILRAGGVTISLVEAAAVAGAAILGGTLTMLPLGTQDGISALVLAELGVDLSRGFALALFHTLLSLACGGALAVWAGWRGGTGE